MESFLLIVIAILVLYIAYLQFRLALFPPRTVIVVPETGKQNSGAGCASAIIIIVLGVVLLIVLGSLLSVF